MVSFCVQSRPVAKMGLFSGNAATAACSHHTIDDTTGEQPFTWRIFHMRKAMLLLAIFGLVGSLWADDPFVGTWKFDIAKSKVQPNAKGATVKEAMLVIGEIGTTDRESYNKTTYTDGSSTLTKWIVPRQGGIVKHQQGGPAKGILVVVTRIAGDEDYWTYVQDGKQVGVGHYTVSKDGKIFRGTFKGIDTQGKPYEEVHVGHRP
jgi:hypothetical protein